jgi:exopolysaccharide production protein ExoZ
MQRAKFSKVENLQALRGLAVLLVVGRHIMVFGERSIGQIDFCRDLFLSGDAGVDLFFAISGFVMVMTTIGKFQQPASAGQFIFRRATRIYPLYWLFSLVTLAIFILHPELINRTGRGIQINLLSSFFLWPDHGLPLLGQGWSLTYELYFYVIFTGLLFFSEQLLPRLILCWAIFVVGVQGFAIAAHWQLDPPIVKVVFDPLVLEFIGGALTAILFSRGWIPRFGWWIAGLGVVGVAIAGITFHGEKSITEVGTTRFFAYGVPCILIVFGAVAAELKSKAVMPRLLQKIGDISYSIYLSHILVIAGLAHFWHKKPSANLIEQGLMAIVMYAAVILVGTISYVVIEKPMHEFFRRISAGFKKRPIAMPVAESVQS